jgi:hypothetical protein
VAVGEEGARARVGGDVAGGIVGEVALVAAPIVTFDILLEVPG